MHPPSAAIRPLRPSDLCGVTCLNQRNVLYFGWPDLVKLRALTQPTPMSPLKTLLILVAGAFTALCASAVMVYQIGIMDAIGALGR